MHIDPDGILHIEQDDPYYAEEVLDTAGKAYRSAYCPCPEQPKERETVKEPWQVARYRPIVKEVEAWRMDTFYSDTEKEAFFAWCPDARYRKKDGVLVVDTLEGDVQVNLNDYVVKLEDSFIVLSRDEHYRKYEYVGKKSDEGTTNA